VSHCRRFCRREESEHPASRFHCARVNQRQVLIETLNPKLIHADSGQFSPELPLRGRKKLQICGADGRLKRKRVGKAECRTPSHRRSPRFLLLRLLNIKDREHPAVEDGKTMRSRQKRTKYGSCRCRGKGESVQSMQQACDGRTPQGSRTA